MESVTTQKQREFLEKIDKWCEQHTRAERKELFRQLKDCWCFRCGGEKLEETGESCRCNNE